WCAVWGGGGLVGKAGGAIVALSALGDRGFRILGERPEDRAGYVARAGDFNGDGLQDLLIGAPNPLEPESRAYVVHGGVARPVRLYDLGDDGVRISGAGVYMLGYGVEGIGDFNGDGRDDIAVVDLPAPPRAATLYIIYGEAAAGRFIRGDSNRDGKVQLSDAVHILGYLFL